MVNRPTSGMQNLSLNASLIRNLYISDLDEGISPQAWLAIAEYCTGLRTLSLENISGQYSWSFKTLQNRLQPHHFIPLETISISSSPISLPFLTFLLKATKKYVKSLTLAGTGLTESELVEIPPLVPNLINIFLGDDIAARSPFSSTRGLGTLEGTHFGVALSNHCKNLICIDLTGAFSLSSMGLAALVMVPSPLNPNNVLEITSSTPRPAETPITPTLRIPNPTPITPNPPTPTAQPEETVAQEDESPNSVSSSSHIGRYSKFIQVLNIF
jgi:hypothetical protein